MDELDVIEYSEEEILENNLSRQWVSPEKEFQGQKLAKFGAGAQALWRQIIDEEDKFAIYGSYLVFLLISLEKDKLSARKLAFNKEKFRNEAQDWLDEFPRTALEEISSLAASLFNESNEAAVSVVPEENSGPQKKITTPVD